MGTRRTTTGKVKTGLALDPQAYQMLQVMSGSPRKMGELLDGLIYAEAARRENVARAGGSTERIRGASLSRVADAERGQSRPERSAREPRFDETAAYLGRPSPQLQYQADLRGSINDAVVATDADLRITSWNHAAETMFGWSAEEAVGQLIADIIPTEFVAASRQAVYDELDSAGAWRGEMIVTRRNGIPVHVEATGVAFRDADGQIIGRVGVNRDITERVEFEARHAASQAEILKHYERAERELAERKRAEEQLRQQSERLRVLHDIGQAILSGSGTAEIASKAARGTRAALGASRVSVLSWEHGRDTIEVVAIEGVPRPGTVAGMRVPISEYAAFERNRLGETVVDPDLSAIADPTEPVLISLGQGLQSYACVPLLVGGVSVGALVVGRSLSLGWTDEDLALTRQIADSLAVAMHQARLFEQVQASQEQLRRLSHHLVTLQEAERKRLSAELHDGSGQTLTALKMALSVLRRKAEGLPEIQARVDELRQMADQTASELHDLATGLRPSALDRYGLVAGLEQLIAAFRKQNPGDVDLRLEGLDEERLGDDARTALYRIIQEGLTNVSRYARAASVRIVLHLDGDDVHLRLEDDGCGFDVDEALRRGRLGILGMRERAEMLGGTLTIESRPAQGTTVFATVPVHHKAADSVAVVPGRERAKSTDAAGDAAVQDMPLGQAAELARAKALSDVLVEITAGMARCASAEAILSLVLSRAAEAIGCDIATIMQRKVGHWVVSHGYHAPGSMIGLRVDDQDAPSSLEVERTHSLVVVNDARQLRPESAAAAAHFAFRSFACIPLLAGGRLLGSANFIYNAAAIDFKPSEIEFLNHLSSLVSLALENVQLHELEVGQRDELARRVGELESLLDLAPVGIGIAYDTACSDMRVNRAFASMVALAPGASPSLSNEGTRPTNFRFCRAGQELAPDDLPMQRAAACGVSVQGDVLEVVRDDGTALDLLAYAVPLFNPDGQRRGAVGAFVNITEQRRIQADAEAARQTVEAILAAIADGLVVYDREGRIVRSNAAAEEFLGYSASTRNLPIGERATSLVQPTKPDGTAFARHEFPAVRALGGEVVRNEEMILHVPARGGGDLPVSVSSAPICAGDGMIVGCVTTFASTEAFYRASAERDRLLVENRRQREFLERAFEAAPVAVSTLTGPEYRFVLANGSYQQTIGRGQDLAGRSVTEVFPAEMLAVVRPLLDRAYHDGETAHLQEFQANLGPERQETYWNGAYVPLRDAAGQVDAVLVIAHEVTEQVLARHAEVAARVRVDELRAEVVAERDRLQAVLTSIPDEVWFSDRDGNFTLANPAAVHGLGFDKPGEIFQPVPEWKSLEMFLPDGQPRPLDAAPLLRSLRGEVVRYADELVRNVKTGELRQRRASSAPVRNRAGEITGAVAVVRDVTDLVALGRQLRESQAQYQTLQEAIPDLVWSADAAGTVDFLNRHWREYMGLTLNELHASGWRVICHPDDAVLLAGMWAQAAADGGQFEAEFRFRRHDGVYRWFWIRVVPVTDAGRIVRWVGVATDIEARKRAEAERDRLLAELRHSRDALDARVQERTAELVAANARLSEAHAAGVQREAALQYQATLLANVSDAIIGMNADLNLDTWSGGAEELYGWRAEEVLGRHLTQVTRAQMTAAERADMMRTLAEKGRWRGSAIHLRRDGSPFWVEGSVMALRDANGTITGYGTVNRDITAQMHAEEQLRQQSQRLALLHEIERSILAAHAPADIAQATAERIQQALGAVRVGVHLFDAQHETAEIVAVSGVDSAVTPVGSHWPLALSWGIAEIKQGRIATIPDVADLPDSDPFKSAKLREGTRSVVVCPLTVSGQVLGQLSTQLPEPGVAQPDVVAWVSQVADSLALAVHNARLRTDMEASQLQLQALSRRLVERQEQERGYVADRLINEAAQVIAALKMQAGLLPRRERLEPPSTDWLRDLNVMMDQVLTELHRLAADLRPAVLDRLGFSAALKQYGAEFEATHGIAVRCVAQGLDRVRLPGALETAAYRVAQEALTNVAQHAHARQAEVTMTRTGGKLRLIVQDDGVGFDVQAAMARGALGIVGMRERVEALGGWLEVESAPGTGTRLTAELPINDSADAQVS